MQPERGTLFQRHFLPMVLAALSLAIVIGFVYAEILSLNRFTGEHIGLVARWPDILIGLTVYLKTSIDFALFMGNLMHENGGWKNRISIQLGTILGNTFGTMVVLLIWAIFREVSWLLGLMILVAAVVLFRLAEEGLSHAIRTDQEYPLFFRRTVHAVEVLLRHINWFTGPFLKLILPDLRISAGPRRSWWALFFFSITVPFVLGLDNFAGYVPLFSIVNVFGFAIGVFAAHALLNIFLYLSPERTTRAVRNPVISLLGSIVFIGLAVFGIIEAANLLLVH